MATKTKDPAAKLFKMLAFQYKPLEKVAKEMLPANEWSKYKKLPATRKIIILDRLAFDLGM